MSGPLITPTKGEALFVWRRRAEMNQVDAAEELGVSPDKYREWEADRGGDIPRKAVGQLKDYEAYTLLRRRKKMTQDEVARRIGVSRLWVHQMEAGQGPIERLAQFWGA